MTSQRIRIERLSSNLQREIWEFYFHADRMKLFLVEYRAQTRKSTRHRIWDTQKHYNKYAGYNERGGMLKLETVPLPEDVKIEAKDVFVK